MPPTQECVILIRRREFVPPELAAIRRVSVFEMLAGRSSYVSHELAWEITKDVCVLSFATRRDPARLAATALADGPDASIMSQVVTIAMSQ
jgi:hypothetical protein